MYVQLGYNTRHYWSVKKKSTCWHVHKVVSATRKRSRGVCVCLRGGTPEGGGE